MSGTPTLDDTLKVAEDVLEALGTHHVDAVMVGAMALAVHGYPRDTVDLDLAVAMDPPVLHQVASALVARGYDVEVRDPDAGDPLGGVMDVRSTGADLVQVINFLNPPSGGFPRLVADALEEATPLVEGGALRVVDPYHLVVFKIYAGGPKSLLDILELLERNPSLDRSRLMSICKAYRLHRELERILKLAGDDLIR